MNTYEYKEAVERAVASRNFHETFRLLRVMLAADNWRLRNELDTLEDDYSRIIDFTLTGAPDPTRQEQISGLVTRIYGVLDMLIRESLIPEHSSLYFNVVRTLKLRRGESLSSLLDEYRQAVRALHQITFAAESKAQAATRRRATEDIEHRLFERIWVTTPLAFDEIASLRGFMADDTMPEQGKAAVIGAITMSSLQFFNEAALKLLLENASENIAPEIRARAIVGALLVMTRWPQRSNSSTTQQQLEALRDSPEWCRYVEHTFLEFIRTADVEKITRTMRDEIIPEVMKLRPDIEKHISEKGGFDPSDLEANPEWEDLLGKSGLSEKLRKLSEMQEEGGDLFYPMFSMLKSYPFFNQISHWFIPFSASHSEVKQALGHDAALEILLEESPVMCAGDKYSFALSVNSLPDAQKQMLMNQLGEAAGGLLAMRSQVAAGEAVTACITSYVHDLYRFFNLFRRAGEFANPFKRPANPASVPAIAKDFREPDKLRLLGEFYFKHGHMEEALCLFSKLDPDVVIYQKSGYALQSIGRIDEAIQAYERAEMLAPESEWTLKRLAHLNKAKGNPRKALEYYTRLEKINPDSPEIALQTGHCHLELNELREALHYYYKAEMLDEKSTKTLRPIAWCSFLNKDYETASRYFDRIFAELKPSASDYLNLGHLALARGNVREAMNNYALGADNVNALTQSLNEDIPMLRQAGIDTSIIPLLIDAIRYKND